MTSLSGFGCESTIPDDKTASPTKPNSAIISNILRSVDILCINFNLCAETNGVAILLRLKQIEIATKLVVSCVRMVLGRVYLLSLTQLYI